MIQPPVPQPTSSTRRKMVGSGCSERTPPIPAVIIWSPIVKRVSSFWLFLSRIKYVPRWSSLYESEEVGMASYAPCARLRVKCCPQIMDHGTHLLLLYLGMKDLSRAVCPCWSDCSNHGMRRNW